MAVAVTAQTDVDKQFEDPELKVGLKVLSDHPFKADVKHRKLLANGAAKARKPRPFRYPERRPKMTIKQVSRKNVHVSPTYVVAHPHPYYYGYPYAAYPYQAQPYPIYLKNGTVEGQPPRDEAPAAEPTPAPVPRSPPKTTDEYGRPMYPEWARDVLGTYRPHDIVVHPALHPHYPYGGVIVAPKAPKAPTYKAFLNNKYELKDATAQARYHYAMDACQRKGKNWSQKRRYQCFRAMWKQYKPNKSNSINAVRDRVQKDCMKFSDNPELRSKCFDDHIKNYEDRLLAKPKKIASGLS